ncbi:MAG: class A beta-lactamase-related serine hydrolase [Firmicutes bacterium]|nr:class A beta-lactamase-related serine hydrolase [Bacillota bacterium]
MTLETLLEKAPGRYGIYAKELESGAILAYHPHDIFPSASTIKVPIMAEVYRRVEEEHACLDDLVVMHREDQVGGSGVLQDLTSGSKFCIRDLTTLMITVSDNTATNLLIDYLGLDAINQMIVRLGMKNTELVRRLQRLPADRPDTYNHTTAFDLTLVMEKLACGQCVSELASQHMVELLRRCQGPVSIIDKTRSGHYIGEPGAITVAHKTGSLDQARHDTGIVYRSDGRVYVATILSDGAPFDQLAKVMEQLARYLPRWLRSVPLQSS